MTYFSGTWLHLKLVYYLHHFPASGNVQVAGCIACCRRLLTTLSVLESLDVESGTVVPASLKHGKFVHFSMISNDILSKTVDSRSMFQPTEVAGWQRLLENMLLLYFPV